MPRFEFGRGAAGSGSTTRHLLHQEGPPGISPDGLRGLKDRTGWQPQWIWEWIDRKRQPGPPPLPALPPSDLGDILGLGAPNPFAGGISGLLNPPRKK